MIRLVFTGTSGAVPSVKHPTSCFAVKYGGVYLFDCGEGMQRQLMKYGVSFAQTQAIFITHLHADHFLGVLGLCQTLDFAGRKEELCIYGPRGTKAFFKKILALKPLAVSFPVKIKDVNTTKAGKVLENGLFAVKSFPVRHGCAAVGYALEEKPHLRFKEDLARSKGIHGRLFTEIMEKGKLTVNGSVVKLKDVTYEQKGKKIVYSGDTMYSDALVEEAKEADLLVHDACFSGKHADNAKETRHSTVADAANAAKNANVKKLVLTHFSNRYDDRQALLEEAKKIFPETVEATEGMELLV